MAAAADAGGAEKRPEKGKLGWVNVCCVVTLWSGVFANTPRVSPRASSNHTQTCVGLHNFLSVTPHLPPLNEVVG